MIIKEEMISAQLQQLKGKSGEKKRGREREREREKENRKEEVGKPL